MVLVDPLGVVPVFLGYVVKRGLAWVDYGVELFLQIQFHLELTRLQTATARELQSGP
jgi:hypothetical protein